MCLGEKRNGILLKNPCYIKYVIHVLVKPTHFAKWTHICKSVIFFHEDSAFATYEFSMRLYYNFWKWVAVTKYDTCVWITSSSWHFCWSGYRGGRSSHDGCSLGDIHYLWTRPDFDWTLNGVSREHSSAHARLHLSSIRILWIFLR